MSLLARNRIYSLFIKFGDYVGHVLQSSHRLPPAFALVVLPIISFATWIPLDHQHGGDFGLSSVTIGGEAHSNTGEDD